MFNVALRIAAWLAEARRRQDGQGLVEYSLILSLVAVVVIAALMTVGADIIGSLTSVGNDVNSTADLIR